MSSYKQYKKRLTARRRYTKPGHFQIDVPKNIIFKPLVKEGSDGEAMMTDDSLEGAACAASTSRQNATAKIIRKTIMTSACQNDFDSLKEAYECEMVLASGDERKIEGVANQISCALVHAVTSKNTSLASAILDIMNPDAVQSVSKWPLLSQYAITSDSVEIVELFIKRNVLSVEHGSVLLHHAARIGNTVIMRKLLDWGSIDINKPTNNVTPLQTAVVYGKNFCAGMLLDASANVKVSDITGKTPLHEAAIRGNEAMVQRLLQLGADPEAADQEGKTPWLYANLYRHTRTAKRIGKALPKEHFTTPLFNMKTYLHLAVEHGITDLVDELIEMGCDPVAKDNSGHTPLMSAVNGSFISLAAIKKLLQNDSVQRDINSYNSDSDNTVLSLALQHGTLQFLHKKVVDLLLEAGASIDLELNGDETVLMRHFTNKEKRDFLIEKGADVSKVTSKGKNVLWVACHRNINKEELEDLLVNNLDVGLGQHVYEQTGTTAFVEAMRLSSIQVAKLLYFADCSLNGLDTWTKSTEGQQMLARSVAHKEFLDIIEKSGETRTTLPLWRQARMSILRAMPFGTEVEGKVQTLGLPVSLSRVLCCRHYRKEKEMAM